MQGPTPTAPASGTEPLYVYVQLRPGTQFVRKCLAHVDRLIAKHGAQVSVAGLTPESHQVLLTIAVDPGPADQIAKPSDEVVTAYNFVAAVFTDMFDFLPQYTSAPSAEARALVAQMPPMLANATDTGTESAAIAV